MDTKERIFELLDEKKIEQKAFAIAVGVSEATVSNWRVGKSNSYNRFLVQIAQALGTTSEYLLTGEENSPPALADELNKIYPGLSPAARSRVVDFARYLRDLEDKQGQEPDAQE